LGTYVRKIGALLVHRGHRVTVFVIGDRTAFWCDGAVAVREVKRVRIPKWVKGWQFHAVVSQILSSRRLARAVWCEHAAAPFDILQTSSSYFSPGYGLLGNGRVPLVCRVSSYTPLWRAADGKRRSFSDYLVDWLQIALIQGADAVFAPSAIMAQIFLRFEGVAARVIHTPIDLPSVSPDPSFYERHLAGTQYVLYFGAVKPMKGVDLLREVMPSLFERYERLALVLIGHDEGMPDGTRISDHIAEQCKPFLTRLHVFAPLPHEQLYPVISHAAGVLMPSRIDIYPNACLEAQSMGVPVVGAYDSSLEELIVDGETGFLAANGDPQSLQAQIERLLSLSEAERDRMRERSTAAVRAMKSEYRVGRLTAFYEETIDRFQGAAGT